jgi:hypothetical protein
LFSSRIVVLVRFLSSPLKVFFLGEDEEDEEEERKRREHKNIGNCTNAVAVTREEANNAATFSSFSPFSKTPLLLFVVLLLYKGSPSSILNITPAVDALTIAMTKTKIDEFVFREKGDELSFSSTMLIFFRGVYLPSLLLLLLCRRRRRRL